MSAKCQKRTSRECSCAFNNQDGPDGPTCVLSAANDATASRAYLHDTSQKGAEAPKEGGFLGLGGVHVTDSEKATLVDIKKVVRKTSRMRSSEFPGVRRQHPGGHHHVLSQLPVKSGAQIFIHMQIILHITKFL